MSGIRVLDEHTINKIAAGEVVQNPASIVKELIENSIDAGASGIIVEIEQGGIKRVRVTDNGSGIIAADIELAVCRHATSKITNAADLETVRTLGFRGEALSSIAAVSMCELRTRTADAQLGTVAKVSGGKVESVKPAGLPQGTTIIAANLFYNTPARLKFLRPVAAETAAVSETVAHAILSFPEVSFHYISNGETIYRSPGTGSLEDALISVYGRHITDKVLFVSSSSGDISVSGYIGLPQFAGKTRKHQSFFVNRRCVKNSFLSRTLTKAYSQRLLHSHYPFALLFIELPPQDIDVNVHPQKLEVKFRREDAVDAAICNAVNDALVHADITGSIAALEEAEPPEQHQLEAVLITDDETTITTGFTSLRQQDDNDYRLTASGLEARYGVPAECAQSYEMAPERTITPDPAASERPTEYHVSTLASSPNAGVVSRCEHRIIGTAFDCYLLIQSGDDLVVIDQHAAHERILYEKTAAQIRAREVSSQLLLQSELYTCTSEELQAFEANKQTFFDIGFDIEPFGQHQLKLSAVPAVCYGLSVRSLMDEMFFTLSGPATGDVILRRDRLISAMCRKAVKEGDSLTDAEVCQLIDEYIQTGEYPTCPHGRPIVTVISKYQLERSFKRRL